MLLRRGGVGEALGVRGGLAGGVLAASSADVSAYRSGHAWSQHAFHGEHVKSALMKQQNGRGHRV